MLRSVTSSTVTSRRRRGDPGAPPRPALETNQRQTAPRVAEPAVPAQPAGRELSARFYRGLADPTRLALLEFCASGVPKRNVTGAGL